MKFILKALESRRSKRVISSVVAKCRVLPNDCLADEGRGFDSFVSDNMLKDIKGDILNPFFSF